jgi:hypothetical protein
VTSHQDRGWLIRPNRETTGWPEAAVVDVVGGARKRLSPAGRITFYSGKNRQLSAVVHPHRWERSTTLTPVLVTTSRSSSNRSTASRALIWPSPPSPARRGRRTSDGDIGRAFGSRHHPSSRPLAHARGDTNARASPERTRTTGPRLSSWPESARGCFTAKNTWILRCHADREGGTGSPGGGTNGHASKRRSAHTRTRQSRTARQVVVRFNARPLAPSPELQPPRSRSG